MKTIEEISALKVAIQNSLNDLPSHDVFGDSNKEFIEEMTEQVTALEKAEAGAALCGNDEIQNWIAGKPSDLNDYL